MILDDILESKRDEVRELRVRGEAELLREARAAAPPRPFAEALAGGREVAVIAEFKRRSPSAGDLAPDADPARVAEAYRASGAAAMSVLTDGPRFGGSLDDLRAARRASALPVLRKDFVVDPLQVLEARAAGADAVLLIARALSPTRLHELLEAARETGMDALVEVHDADELETALEAGAGLIGVNARDLATFGVDLGRCAELVRRVPGDRIAVAESGVEGPEDVARMGRAGADAVLVGTALMRTAAGEVLAELTGIERRKRRGGAGRRGRPAVKICGLRRREDVRAAVEAGADYVGLVFADSPRRVSPGRASELVEGAPTRAVGVFVDAGREVVLDRADAVPLEVVQLHGDEPPELCASLRASGLTVWKALRPRSRVELRREVERYRGSVDGLLVEGHSEEAAGGTGTSFPREWWGEAGLRADPDGPEMILAGGLEPDDVGEAVARTGPDVVDVSSGVEREPGVKDPDRIRAFVRAVRDVGEPS